MFGVGKGLHAELTHVHLPQSETGFLQYLDFSVGKEVATICTRGGRLGVMGQNPANAIIHLGHSNGERHPFLPHLQGS